MTDGIAKLNEVLGKILAYGPSRQNDEKKKKIAKKIKPRKKRVALR